MRLTIFNVDDSVFSGVFMTEGNKYGVSRNVTFDFFQKASIGDVITIQLITGNGYSGRIIDVDLSNDTFAIATGFGNLEFPISAVIKTEKQIAT